MVRSPIDIDHEHSKDTHICKVSEAVKTNNEIILPIYDKLRLQIILLISGVDSSKTDHMQSSVGDISGEHSYHDVINHNI